MKKLAFLLLAVLSVTIFSCTKSNISQQAITPFESNKYLGKWYEIARIDFYFEKGLDNCTAQYSNNADGSFKVLNRGYNKSNQTWKENIGKAVFNGPTNVGSLKVSFFEPFFAEYNVIAIAGDYQYALVAGKNYDYLWLLSREKTMPDAVKQTFLNKATQIGYDVNKLIWVNQDMN